MSYPPEVIRKGAGYAAFSYLYFFSIFVLIYKRDNEFVKFHASQSLVIFILEVFLWVLTFFLPLINFLVVLCMVLFLFFRVAGVFSSLMGKEIHFPLITKIARKMVI